MLQWLEEIVLRAAAAPEDLTRFLHRETLTTLRPELYLPNGVRQARDEHHLMLRTGAVP